MTVLLEPMEWKATNNSRKELPGKLLRVCKLYNQLAHPKTIIHDPFENNILKYLCGMYFRQLQIGYAPNENPIT